MLECPPLSPGNTIMVQMVCVESEVCMQAMQIDRIDQIIDAFAQRVVADPQQEIGMSADEIRRCGRCDGDDGALQQLVKIAIAYYLILIASRYAREVTHPPFSPDLLHSILTSISDNRWLFKFLLEHAHRLQLYPDHLTRHLNEVSQWFCITESGSQGGGS